MKVLWIAALLCLQEEAEEVKVVREWKGQETKIDAAECQRVTDAESWTKLWQRHMGNPRERAPEVDFTKNMVVACFLGPRAHHEIEFYSAKKTKDELVFGVMVSGEDCCDFSKHPLFYIAVVPKCDLKLSVIGRVKQELDVDPTKDEMLKEFPAIKE
jgi:hypothetical protein